MLVEENILKEINKDAVVLLMGSLGSVAVCRNLMSKGVSVIGISKRKYLLKTKMSYSISISDNNEILPILEKIMPYLKKKPIILTDSDEYVDLLLFNIKTLKENYIIPYCNDIERTKTLMNKNQVSKFAEEIGIDIPKTIHISKQSDLKKYINEIEFPILVKPLRIISQIKKKAILCDDLHEVDKIVREFLKYGVSVILQQYIPGDVDNQFCITTYRNEAGKIYIGNIVKKIRQYPVEFGMGSCHLTCFNDDIINLTEKILTCSDYVGVSMIEFKYSPKHNKFYLIEVNCRFPIEMQINNIINKDFIYNIYLDLLNTHDSSKKDVEFEIYKKQTQDVVWINDYYDIRACIKYNIIFLIEYIRYLNKYKICWAVFSFHDIKFAFYYNKNLLADIAKKIFKLNRKKCT